MNRKRVLLITAGIVSIIGAYTLAWFIIANKVEDRVNTFLVNSTNPKNIKDISYKINSSCFPALCVEFKDLTITTNKNFAGVKNGVIFDMFKTAPMVLKTYNIFSPKFKFEEQAAQFDMGVKNLDTNIRVDSITDFKDLDILLSKDESSLKAKDILFQAKSSNTALQALFEIDQLFLDMKFLQENNTDNYALSLSVFDFTKFNKETGKPEYNFKHLDNVITLTALDSNFMNTTLSPEEFTKHAINGFKDNGTAITLRDLKFTDANIQLLGQAELYIDKSYFLVANGDFAFNFTKPNSAFEQMLNVYKISKNDKGSYILNIRTKNNVISINNIVTIPSPNFKPTETGTSPKAQ